MTAADPYALMVGFYDLWSAHMTEDVPFYVAQARAAAGGGVVELGAGNGRVAIAVAQAGVDVLAVEPSAAMRADGMRRAVGAAVADRIRWVDADMRSFVADAPVDLVMIPFRSFQHLLSVEDQLRTLAAIRASLRPGGRLVLNIFTVDPTVVAARDGRRAHQLTFDHEGKRHETYLTPRYTVATQRLDVEIEEEVWEADRRVTTREATLRLRTIGRYEMEHLLTRAGLEPVGLAGDFQGKAYGPGPDEMIWIARRP